MLEGVMQLGGCRTGVVEGKVKIRLVVVVVRCI